MPTLNFTKADIEVLIESLNDCLLRSAEYIKIQQLQSLKQKLVKSLEGNYQPDVKEEKKIIKPNKRSKRPST